MRKLFVLIAPVLMLAFIVACSQSDDVLADAHTSDAPVVRIEGNQLVVEEGYELVLTKDNSSSEALVIQSGSSIKEADAQVGKYVCGCDGNGTCQWIRWNSNMIECADTTNSCDASCTVVEVKVTKLN